MISYQQRVDGLASPVDTRLVVFLAKVLFMLAIDSLVQSGAVTEIKLVIDIIWKIKKSRNDR